MKPTDSGYVAYAGTDIHRPADYEGKSGKFWKWDWKDERPPSPAAAASLGDYLLCCPESHPWWWWYILMMIDLRDHPGLPPAVKRFPEAEYEIVVLALSPEHPIPEPEGNPYKDQQNPKLVRLNPADQNHQIPPLPNGDEDARKFLELIAKACADGYLVPDQDFRGRWALVLGNTYEHFIDPEAHGHDHNHD